MTNKSKNWIVHKIKISIYGLVVITTAFILSELVYPIPLILAQYRYPPGTGVDVVLKDAKMRLYRGNSNADGEFFFARRGLIGS